MATFVHIADSRSARRIAKSGIRATKIYLPKQRDHIRGVYAFPVLPNFVVAHQWLRELKRRGFRTAVGVYFHLPDDDRVFVGHYSRNHRSMPSAEAIGFLLRLRNPLGYEVVIPHKIAAKEIRRVKHLPQTLGWRYWPAAHGTRPCPCPICLDVGGIKTRRIRARRVD